MKCDKFFRDFRIRFFKSLNIKNSWGKEEIKRLFDDVALHTLLDYVDDKEQ